MDIFSIQFDAPTGRKMGNSDPNEHVFQDTRNDWGKFTFQFSNATFQLELDTLYSMDTFSLLFDPPNEQKLRNPESNCWISP